MPSHLCGLSSSTTKLKAYLLSIQNIGKDIALVVNCCICFMVRCSEAEQLYTTGSATYLCFV